MPLFELRFHPHAQGLPGPSAGLLNRTRALQPLPSHHTFQNRFLIPMRRKFPGPSTGLFNRARALQPLPRAAAPGQTLCAVFGGRAQ